MLLTARSKTDLTEADDDKDEEEDQLRFTFVACGAMHTMLVTDQGRMLLAVMPRTSGKNHSQCASLRADGCEVSNDRDDL